jgi:hypothetical protein
MSGYYQNLFSCGSSAVEGLNEALLARALSAKVLKTNRVRADTTVVPADIAYPTDSDREEQDCFIPLPPTSWPVASVWTAM